MDGDHLFSYVDQFIVVHLCFCELYATQPIRNPASCFYNEYK